MNKSVQAIRVRPAAASWAVLVFSMPDRARNDSDLQRAELVCLVGLSSLTLAHTHERVARLCPRREADAHQDCMLRPHACAFRGHSRRNLHQIAVDVDDERPTCWDEHIRSKSGAHIEERCS